MALRYSFREDGGPSLVSINNRNEADPQVIGKELTRIQAEQKGRMKPGHVVEAARNRRNVLHRHFEWSDEVAAQAYRLDQARELIGAIKIEDTTTDEPPRRAFLSIYEDGERSYRSVQEVLTSASLQLALLHDAERDLKAFESRYDEFVEICSKIRDARRAVSRRIEAHEEARATA
jgi:hypothetical protein